MPRLRRSRPRRRKLVLRLPVIAATIAAVLLVLAGSSAAGTVNSVVLDNGTCGQNLQMGWDPAASASPTPTFLLFGDGGLSKYSISIDGNAVGTFSSDGWGNVCIPTSARLTDGAHVLTGTELQPHAGSVVTPFNFSVDTVAPVAPSTPVLASWSQSGLVGSGVTAYRTVNFSGTAEPQGSLQLYSGVSGIGGAKVDAAGNWSATTSSLADGVYVVKAGVSDAAGNKSPLSAGTQVTIDNTAPSAAISSPASGATVAGTVNVAASPTDNVGVWKVAFQVDGTTKTTVTASPWVYAWPSGSVANGTHTLAVTVYDLAGNTSSASESVNVANGATATVPGAPTLASATAGNGSVALAWSAGSDGGSAITGYKIYRGTTTGSETLLTTLGNVTSWTDSNVANGTTYYYKVSAVNSVGESATSNERSATPATTPGAPALNAPTVGNGSVGLSWTAPPTGGSAITGYNVYRGTTSSGETFLTTLGNVSSWTDTGVVNGTTYYYKVSAVNGAGEGPLSNERSATPSAPATTPGAPTLNSATAGNTSVSLGWSAPASDGGSAITGYKVYRGTTSGGETLLTTLGNVTSWTDTGVVNGTTYYYKVSAVNAVGEGLPSNEKSATPTAPATVPGAPTLASATSGNSSVALAWSAPASNGGSAITTYKVYRGTTSGGETLLTTLGNVTSWTDTSVANGTTYYYQVSAVNAIGEGLPSNEKNATPTAPATVPGAPTLASATGGNSSVALAWSAGSDGGSAITGYKVYRSTSSGTETLLTTLGNVTSWSDTSVANGTTYYYKVSATNSVGEGALSNERSATPATTPAAPTLNVPTAGNGSVGLSWTAPSTGGSAINAYKVYRGTTSGGETLLTTLGNVTSWTDTGAGNGTTYYYKVSAVNAVGEGAVSNERSATPATSPGTPTLDSATAGNASVALAWSAPASNGGSAITGYKVYRGTTSGGETLLTTLGNVTSWTDTGAANGTTYYYKVSAMNGVGEGLPSNERSATPSAPATTAGAPTLNSAAAGDTSVSLDWSAPASDGGSAITGYKVYRGATSGGETLLTTLGNVTSWTDTGVVNGTTYYYKVSAMNGVGEGLPSNEKSATPAASATAPGAPILSSATAGDTSVSLAWSAPANGGSAITNYKVYRGTTSGTETFLTTLGNVTSWTDTGVVNGTTYYYQVSAVNAVGEGLPSSEQSATPAPPVDTTPPTQPTSLRAPVTGTSQIALQWTASTDASGIASYEVFRDGTLVGTTGTTHFLDSGLTPRTSHVYQVRAVDNAGNRSILSPKLSVKVPALGRGSTGTLSGVVYDQTGNPVSGVTVTVSSGGTTKTATTTTSGTWKIGSLPAGTYTVSVAGAVSPNGSAAVVLGSGQTILTISSV